MLPSIRWVQAKRKLLLDVLLRSNEEPKPSKVTSRPDDNTQDTALMVKYFC